MEDWRATADRRWLTATIPRKFKQAGIFLHDPVEGKQQSPDSSQTINFSDKVNMFNSGTAAAAFTAYSCETSSTTKA